MGEVGKFAKTVQGPREPGGTCERHNQKALGGQPLQVFNTQEKVFGFNMVLGDDNGLNYQWKHIGSQGRA